MITEYRKYSEWLDAVSSRNLVVVNRFKAFDRSSNFFGFFNWPGLEEVNGWLSDTVGELIMSVEEIKLDVTSIRKLPRIWVMTVDSENIKNCAYDYANEHLYLQFHSSEIIYRYHEIPIEYWLGMTSAESVGKYFHKTKKLLVDYCTIKLKKKKERKE